MTPLPRVGAPDALYLFDMHAWVYRYWHATGEYAAKNVVRFVGTILEQRAAAYAAVCRDMPGPTFRTQLAPRASNGEGYKANREPPDPQLIERITWTNEMLEDVHGLPVYGRLGFEADDLLATLTTQAKARGLRVVIVTTDKDLLQLVDEQCVLWDGKDIVHGIEEVEARFGVRVDQLRDYLAICGDSSDNVPGLRGAGPKAAVKLLTQFGTLKHALDSARTKPLDSFWLHHAKYCSMLREQNATVLLSQQLVTLAHDAPLTFRIEELRRP